MRVELIKDVAFRFIKLIFGFIVCAFGVSLMFQANLGLDPWGTLHKGMLLKSGISFGQASQLTGVIVIFIGMALKIMPGIGTILNMYVIGYFIDFFNSAFPFEIVSYPTRFLTFFLGMFVLALGIYLYLSSDFGAGPRDGLMIGLMHKTGKGVGQIKTSIEVSVLVFGMGMGALPGIGTAIFALGMGPLLGAVMKILNYNPKENKPKNLKDQYVSLRESFEMR